MHLAAGRADSPFTTRWYNDTLPDGSTRPVWSIAPASCIVAPTGEIAARPVEVWGWAWCDGGIARVEVSTDGGTTWRDATLDPATGRGWQRFALDWAPGPGPAVLMSRATDTQGATQPAQGARNAVFSVAVRRA